MLRKYLLMSVKMITARKRPGLHPLASPGLHPVSVKASLPLGPFSRFPARSTWPTSTLTVCYRKGWGWPSDTQNAQGWVVVGAGFASSDPNAQATPRLWSTTWGDISAAWQPWTRDREEKEGDPPWEASGWKARAHPVKEVCQDSHSCDLWPQMWQDYPF